MVRLIACSCKTMIWADNFSNFSSRILCGLDRVITVNGTHGLVIEYAYLMDLCRQFREFSVVFHCGFIHRNHLETLSKNASAYESDLVSAPERWNKSIARCWSLGLGNRTCQLSQRGFSAVFCSEPCSVSFFIFVFGFLITTLGVIYSPPSGQGSLWYKQRFVLQKTHLANIKSWYDWSIHFGGGCFGILPPCIILACKVTADFQISHYQPYSLFFLSFPSISQAVET